jgi:hypothetical protein
MPLAVAEPAIKAYASDRATTRTGVISIALLCQLAINLEVNSDIDHCRVYFCVRDACWAKDEPSQERLILSYYLTPFVMATSISVLPNCWQRFTLPICKPSQSQPFLFQLEATRRGSKRVGCRLSRLFAPKILIRSAHDRNPPAVNYRVV